MTAQLHGQDLDNYLWKKRVVLLFEDNANKEQIKEQLTLLRSDTKALEERDIVIYAVQGKKAEELQEQLLLRSDFRGLALIGKDGGVKFKGNLPVSLDTLLSLIDGMPMRRAEMRSSNKKPD